MAIIKNVLKGYESKYDITEISIIDFDNDDVLYSGRVKLLKDTARDNKDFMCEHANFLLSKEVAKVLNFNSTKLFIFV